MDLDGTNLRLIFLISDAEDSLRLGDTVVACTFSLASLSEIYSVALTEQISLSLFHKVQLSLRGRGLVNRLDLIRCASVARMILTGTLKSARLQKPTCFSPCTTYCTFGA